MAPKRLSAASAATPSPKKATKRDSVASPLKRPAASGAPGRLAKKSCAHIAKALAGVQGLSPEVRKAMEALIGHGICSDGLPAPYRNAAIAMVREALAGTAQQLERALAEAKARVSGAEDDRAARDAALEAAEASLASTRQTILDAKAALKDVTATTEAARQELKNLGAEQKAQAGELRAAVSKVERLQFAEQDLFAPLKEAGGALGPEERKQLKSLTAVGKVFGFHDTLLDSVPAVLKKQLDRRCTFDNVVVGQLETEFAKHFEAMEVELRTHKTKFDQQTSVKEETSRRLTEAAERRQAHARAIAEAEAAIGPAKMAVAAARRHRKAFESDGKKAKVALTRAEGQLRSFQEGPLLAFAELIEEEGPPLEASPLSACAAASAASLPPPPPFGDTQAHGGSETLAWMPTEILTP